MIEHWYQQIVGIIAFVSISAVVILTVFEANEWLARVCRNLGREPIRSVDLTIQSMTATQEQNANPPNRGSRP